MPENGIMTVEWIQDAQVMIDSEIYDYRSDTIISRACVPLLPRFSSVLATFVLYVQQKFTQVVARRAVLRLYDQLESRSGRQVWSRSNHCT